MRKLVEKLRKERKDLIGQVISMKKRYEGKLDLLDLSVGSPNLPPPIWVVETMKDSMKVRRYHGYPPKFGAEELFDSVMRWYKRRFGVNIPSHDNLIITPGIKEAIFDTLVSILNENEKVLVPDPGYPTYSDALIFAGAERIPYNPEEKDEEVLREIETMMEREKPSVIVLNYPHNPTGRLPSFETLSKIVMLARKNGMKILSDMAYSEIFFENESHSVFEIATDFKDTVEFLSFSKTYNMAGWRIGIMVGDAELMSLVKTYRSMKHSGVFYPIQLSAKSALDDTPEEYYEDLRAIYRRRRDILCEELEKGGFSFSRPQGSIYVWAKIPSNFLDMDTMEFVKLMLERTGILVFPGEIFGKNGKKKVRFSLVEEEERLREVGERLKRL